MKHIKQYLTEALHNITHDIKNCVFRTNGGELCYFDSPITVPFDGEALEIQTLVVSNKRQGIGTQLVNACIEYAKSVDKDIILCASPLDNSISEDALIKFYKNLGFKQIKGMNKSFLIYSI